MTSHKHLKTLIRARMNKTGERYASARRHVIAQEQPRMQAASPSANGRRRRAMTPAPQENAPDGFLASHIAGNVPAVTALRVLLNHAGVTLPGGEALSEAMVFGIGGGIGIGVWAFLYEKEGFATFYAAGRHLWMDDLMWCQAAGERLGICLKVLETGGAKRAMGQLAEMLALGPCIAWCDSYVLPNRAMPGSASGCGYHVVTVYEADVDSGQAWIGDLTDTPIRIGLDDLANARARIKKFKNRVAALDGTPEGFDPASAVREGLAVCATGLVQQPMQNFTLESLRTWSRRLGGDQGKDGWEHVFPRGHRLWRGLTNIYEYIELYGTGGGLSRPLFAEFLREAADRLGWSDLLPLAEMYTAIGQEWSDLAAAALPDEVPLLLETRRTLIARAEATAGGELSDLKSAWQRQAELEAHARQAFPLSESECRDLRRDLQARVQSLYEAEAGAQKALARIAGG